MRWNAALVWLGLALAGGGCSTLDRIYIPPAPPAPRTMRGPEPVDWRALLGCWRMVDRWAFVLDSVPAQLRISRPREGARQVTVPGGGGSSDVYWRVTPRNTVELVTDAGLWGTFYEFTVREGRLVGRSVSWTDVVGVYHPYVRAAAERSPCPAVAAG